MTKPFTKFWCDQTRAKLRRLWNDGVSTEEIGRILGTSKDAIIGQAHRMRLEKREKPKRMTLSTWDEDREFELAEHVNFGLCIEDIAEKMQLTQSAVRNKVYKLGLVPKSKFVGQPTYEAPKKNTLFNYQSACQVVGCKHFALPKITKCYTHAA